MTLDIPAPPTWFARAACGPTPDLLDEPTAWGQVADGWFPDARGAKTQDGSPQTSARHAIYICATCPVRLLCLDYAVEHKLEGVWGGTTDMQRKGVRRAS